MGNIGDILHWQMDLEEVAGIICVSIALSAQGTDDVWKGSTALDS